MASEPEAMRAQPVPALPKTTGDLLEHAHERLIGLAVFLGKARHYVSEIRFVETCRFADCAGQETFAEWAERHKADAQLFKKRKYFCLGLAPPQRILALQGRHGLDSVRAANGLSTCLRHAEVLHLSLLDKVFYRAGNVFHRHIGVNPMLIKQVDAVGPQQFQRSIRDFANALTRAGGSPANGASILTVPVK